MPIVTGASAVDERRARSQEHVSPAAIFETVLILGGEINDLVSPPLPTQADAEQRTLRWQRRRRVATICEYTDIRGNGRAVSNRRITQPHIGFELRVALIAAACLRSAGSGADIRSAPPVDVDGHAATQIFMGALELEPLICIRARTTGEH